MENNARTCRYSLAAANCIYAGLGTLACCSSAFAWVFHVTALLLAPFFLSARHHLRVEVTDDRLRYYDWRGRLTVETPLQHIRKLDVGHEEGPCIRTLHGDIPLGSIQEMRGLVRTLAERTGFGCDRVYFLGIQRIAPSVAHPQSPSSPSVSG